MIRSFSSALCVAVTKSPTNMKTRFYCGYVATLVLLSCARAAVFQPGGSGGGAPPSSSFSGNNGNSGGSQFSGSADAGSQYSGSADAGSQYSGAESNVGGSVSEDPAAPAQRSFASYPGAGGGSNSFAASYSASDSGFSQYDSRKSLSVQQNRQYPTYGNGVGGSAVGGEIGGSIGSASIGASSIGGGIDNGLSQSSYNQQSADFGAEGSYSNRNHQVYAGSHAALPSQQQVKCEYVRQCRPVTDQYFPSNGGVGLSGPSGIQG